MSSDLQSEPTYPSGLVRITISFSKMSHYLSRCNQIYSPLLNYALLLLRPLFGWVHFNNNAPESPFMGTPILSNTFICSR